MAMQRRKTVAGEKERGQGRRCQGTCTIQLVLAPARVPPGRMTAPTCILRVEHQVSYWEILIKRDEVMLTVTSA
jgi:hypothetical protein